MGYKKKFKRQKTTPSHGTPPPASSTGTSLNAPVTEPTRPVLNYLIPTGEELARKFMRDRAMSTVCSASFPPAQFPLLPSRQRRGISGIFCRESRNPNQNSPAGNENEPFASPARSVSTPVPSQAMSETSSEHPSISGGRLANTICSFGGKILPRPGDNQLEYVGGDAHFIPIKYHISFQELKALTLSRDNVSHIIKYQYPGMDLDALVSVLEDEDVRNMEMMEECDSIIYGSAEVGGDSYILKMFLIRI